MLGLIILSFNFGPKHLFDLKVRSSGLSSDFELGLTHDIFPSVAHSIGIYNYPQHISGKQTFYALIFRYLNIIFKEEIANEMFHINLKVFPRDIIKTPQDKAAETLILTYTFSQHLHIFLSINRNSREFGDRPFLGNN